MKREKVKIVWHDAVLYSPEVKAVELTRMETVGVVKKETPDFVIISDPITTKLKTKEKYPYKEKPTFFFIPKGMIETIK